MSKKIFFTKLGWDGVAIEDAIQTLKLHALMHGTLVIPSNHIYHKNTEKVLRANPELLELGFVELAFDPKHETFSNYFQSNGREVKAGRSLSSYGKFLDERNVTTDEYSDLAPAGIFTQLAQEQIGQPTSVLSKAANITIDQSERTLLQMTEISNENSGVVYYPQFLEIINSHFTPDQKIPLLQFAKLARTMAGAASKDCSNMLPQENLINWCLANPKNPQEFVLSDEIIFWEVFLKNLVSASEGITALNDLTKLSPSALDRLSLREIQELRNQSEHAKFIEKFSSITQAVSEYHGAKVSDQKLLDFDQLICMKSDMSSSFKSMMQSERDAYRHVEMAETLLSIPYQLFGGVIQAIESVISFVSVAARNDTKWKSISQVRNEKAIAALRYARNRFENEPVLIEFMEAVAKRAKDNWYH